MICPEEEEPIQLSREQEFISTSSILINSPNCIIRSALGGLTKKTDIISDKRLQLGQAYVGPETVYTFPLEWKQNYSCYFFFFF